MDALWGTFHERTDERRVMKKLNGWVVVIQSQLPDAQMTPLFAWWYRTIEIQIDIIAKYFQSDYFTPVGANRLPYHTKITPHRTKQVDETHIGGALDIGWLFCRGGWMEYKGVN